MTKWWNGSHATLRTSCPFGRGSSTLPLVTAGAAGAQPALIRPVSPVRFRGLQSALQQILTQVGQCPVKAHNLRPPGATPGPATVYDRVRKQEKRSGREPDDFVGSTPTPVTS